MKASKTIAAGVLILAALLQGCGGGGSGGSPSPPPPSVTPPTGLTYPSPQTYVVGTAITALNPSVTGTVTAYSVNPALPAGLALNGTTGVISGTPSQATAVASYTMTAANAGGSTSTSLSIAVNAVVPAVSYPRTQLRYSVGNPIPQLDPTNTGGAVVAWSVTPDLPAGLALNPTNGSIFGTPTALAASAPYVVSATNSGGHSEVTLTISVESGVLLNLGHADDPRLIQYSGPRMFSQDSQGHWNLWDAGTAARITSGDSDCIPGSCSGLTSAELAGDTLVIRSNVGFDIRSAVDGTRNSSFLAPASWWDLSADGSYLCAGTATALTAWNSAGQQLFTRAGDYSHAKVFAAATEIRVALGPAGQNLIEKIAVPSGTAAAGTPFTGNFHSWFLDGGRFLTNLGNTVWTYSHATVQEDVANYPSISQLTGQGNWIWVATNSQTLTVYAVGGGNTSTSTFNVPTSSLFSSKLLIGAPGLTNSTADLWVIDLSGGTPSIAHYTPKYPYVRGFGGSSASQWAVGDSAGVLVDPVSTPATPKIFASGEARAIAGSSTRVAVATAVGTIFFYAADTLAPLGQLDISADQVALSADGSVLALRRSSRNSQYGDPDWSVEVYALPAMTLTRKWTTIYPTSLLVTDIDLSGSGTTLAQRLNNGTRSVETISPATVIWSDQYAIQDSTDVRLVYLSTSGDRSATADGRVIAVATPTVIRQGSAIVTAVPATPIGWIDETRLLTNIYVPDNTQRHDPVYDHAAIFDYQGQQLASLPLPSIGRFQTVSSTSVYSRDRNAIYSLTDGSLLWASPNGTPSSAGVGPSSAVAGGRAIFWSGPLVRAEPY